MIMLDRLVDVLMPRHVGADISNEGILLHLCSAEFHLRCV